MVDIFPDDVRYQNILADCHYVKGNLDAAKELYRRVVQRDKALNPHEKLRHRAFCDRCDSAIKEVRLKCQHDICLGLDWCIKCNVAVKGEYGKEGYSESPIPNHAKDDIVYWKGRCLHPQSHPATEQGNDSSRSH
jgi:hypothetical protein